MSLRRMLPSGSSLLSLSLAAGVGLGGTAVADEVVLVPNSTVKGAIGGRVRGTVQSESATEVVVKLGSNAINVPTGEVSTIHYDGQPPSFALAETREAANQL